jgi:hypothetical protein
VACFTLAVLCRETLLVVPAVVVLHGLFVDRRLRPQLPLFIAPAVLAAWFVVVRNRTGAWPTEASRGRLSFGFRGVVQVVDAFAWGEITALILLVLMSVVVLARAQARAGLAGWIVLGHVALASVLGEAVWWTWYDFSRVLLPLLVFGLVALAEAWPTGRSRATLEAPGGSARDTEDGPEQPVVVAGVARSISAAPVDVIRARHLSGPTPSWTCALPTGGVAR